ncbi:MAG: TonB-dependent receptor [Caulobacterales bacterium]|nr:TonB-dependent receptor [Caulobacterales bacterium]
MRNQFLAATAIAAVLAAAPEAIAQDGDPAADGARDAIIVTGTRAADRTAFDSLAPIDVIGGGDIDTVSSDELMDSLARLVPSFNVQRLPLADGLIFVRPATLRGLSPDQTLVLVNGKRRHRSALLGNRGAQAADLANIPTFAIERTEVLRDGASAQYGSDAIAGVINIILDEEPGFRAFAQAQQYYEGDGDQYDVGGRAGFDLDGRGFAGLTIEYTDAERTSRSRQRPDAIAFQEANPGVAVADPVQNWGQPERDALRVAGNVSFELTEAVELYAFGTFAESEGVSDFNWRNPVFTSAFGNVDADGDFVLDGDGGGVSAIDPDYNLLAIFPAGFTPQFGQEQTDYAVAGGARGDADGLLWDVSLSYGDNEIDYFLFDTINASLGSASPTSFNPGVLNQREFNANADFVYGWDTGVLAAPLNIAFGLERRMETYEIEAGDPASFAVGPLAAEGFPSGSNGFPGYSDAQAGEFDQESYAGYIDLEAPVTGRLTLGGALRFEDYSEFGATTDFKVSGRFEVTPDLAARATVSTGFRAPTPGQLFSERTSQGLNTATLNLFTNGRFNPSGPVADVINARDGGPFIVPLDPEESENYSLGLAYRNDLGFTGTIDIYQINVDDRIATFSDSLTDAERAALADLGVPGGEGVTNVSFFQNLFDTETRGVDMVGSYGVEVGPGDLTLTGAYNFNETEVKGDTTGVFSEASRRTFEEGLPQHNASFTGEYALGPVDLMGRVRYYGEWTDTSDDPNEDFQTFGAEVFVDLAATYRVNENVYVRAGAENVFDEYPDESRRQAVRGLIYSRNAPYDTDGGLYYLRVGVDF